MNQQRANYLSTLNNIIILCGHYKGIDQRVRDHLITLEISIGDYVMSGGELAAAVITDCIVRLLPGALGMKLLPFPIRSKITCWLRLLYTSRRI